MLFDLRGEEQCDEMYFYLSSEVVFFLNCDKLRSDL